jgi:hypothetical protein
VDDAAYSQFFASYDQRRALASIARGVLRRARGWVVIWPHIPTMAFVTAAHVSTRAT